MALSDAALRVLRLCSVFEGPPDVVPDPRFDPVGGMQTHTGELTRALDGLGVTQLVVTTRPPGTPRVARLGRSAAVVRLGLPVPGCRQFYAWPAARVLVRRAPRVDLVHAHLGEDLAVVPLAVLAARRRRAPLVLTVHTSPRYTLPVCGPRTVVLKAVGGRCERWGELWADAVITLTPRLARLLVADGVCPGRLHVIPSGVSDPLFDQARVLPPKGLPPRPRVVFLGRLHVQKGLDVLLRALALVPEARLVLAGDGPEREPLRRLAQRLGVADRVTFLGFVPRAAVPGLLASADVQVLPSIYEELGTAVLEGMRIGVPLVASETGGLPSLVTHGVTGLLVPPGDAAALAGALRRLLADRELAARLADQARRESRDYSWTALAERVLAVYRRVLPAPAARR